MTKTSRIFVSGPRASRHAYRDMTTQMGKLLRCTIGSIFDAAVDPRLSSPTFGRHVGADLSAENMRQIYMPPRFGHGFQVLSEVAELQYRQTAFYAPSSEGKISWNDPDAGIRWPLADPILSEPDKQGGSLQEYAKNAAFA